MQPMQPGTYTIYRDSSMDSAQTQESVIAAAGSAKPRHTYVAFRALPCIAEHLKYSDEWLAEQEILRKISHCILTPGTNESDIIFALQSVERNYGFVNMNSRMAQPMVIVGGAADMRVTDILAPVRTMPATTVSVPLKTLEVLSPLHAAVIANKARVAHHLLTGPNGAGSGADVNQPSEWNGRTAVMIAAENGNYDMLDLLLDYDANLLQVDAEGNTALMYAVAFAKVPSAAVVERLIAECPQLAADARALPYAAYTSPACFWGDMICYARKRIARIGGEAALFIAWKEMELIEDALAAGVAWRGGGDGGNGGVNGGAATMPIGFFGAFSSRDPRRPMSGANFQGLL